MANSVCTTCNDTHSMDLNGVVVMCTRCPVPCERCHTRGPDRAGVPYCATTPCPCSCHGSRPAQASDLTVDLDDPEQLAEAAMLGALDAFAITTQQLARLGRAHMELLSVVRRRADSAQISALELDAAKVDLAISRAVNEQLRALIASGRLTEGPPRVSEIEATALLIDAAVMLSGPERATGAVLGALTTLCLNAEQPTDTFQAALDVLQYGLDAYRRIRARGTGVHHAEVDPS